jgi:hypothetical protein
VNHELVTTWKEAWAGHVGRRGEKSNVYRVWVGKPEGRRPLGRPMRTLSIILKRIFRRYSETAWIGFIRFRTGKSGGLL